MQRYLKKILTLVAAVMVISCSDETTQNNSTSRMFGAEDNWVTRVCNSEEVDIHALMVTENELATDTTTIRAWKTFPAGKCIPFEWNSVKASKVFYFQSEKGLYQPRSQPYSYSNEAIVCLPRNAAITKAYSYSYNGKNVFLSGNCPDEMVKYPSTWIADEANSEVTYVNETAYLTYTLQGGRFFESQRVITVEEEGEGSLLDQRIQYLQARLKEVTRNEGPCFSETNRIMSKTKILGTTPEKLDEALTACEYSLSDRDRLKKEVAEAKRLAREQLSLLVAALNDLYSRLVNFGKTVNVTAPYDDEYKESGVISLLRPTVDAESAKAGFFSNLGNKFKQKMSDYYGQYTNSFIASGLAFAVTFSSFGTELGSTPEMDQDKFFDFRNAVGMVDSYFDTIDKDKNDGYPFDSPVPEEIRAVVREHIKPTETRMNAGVAGVNLEDELKKWRGVANPQQILILEAIRHLGLAFQQTLLKASELPGEIEAINKRLASITEGAVTAVKDFAVCAAKVGAAGDFGDWYEIVNKKDICTGEEITFAGQVLSAAGLAIGSAKFWRVMGEAAGIAVTTKRVFKDAEVVVESAKRWDSVESLIHVVKGNYQIASDGSRKLVSGMHTKLGFDNFLKLNQSSGKAYSIRDVTEFTAERIEAGGAILSQTLDNGVRRIQLPRDAWVNSDAFNKAIAYTESGQKVKGVKTLFPEAWDLNKIAEATEAVKVSASSSREGNIITGVYELVNVRIVLEETTGKVITAYPFWRQ